jgi:hypothetical protein
MNPIVLEAGRLDRPLPLAGPSPTRSTATGVGQARPAGQLHDRFRALFHCSRRVRQERPARILDPRTPEHYREAMLPLLRR